MGDEQWDKEFAAIAPVIPRLTEWRNTANLRDKKLQWGEGGGGK